MKTNLILPSALEQSQMPALSELEAGLDGPAAAEVRAAALARIGALELRLKQTLDRGVPSKDFSQYSELLAACQASREVLQIVARATNPAGA